MLVLESPSLPTLGVRRRSKTSIFISVVKSPSQHPHPAGLFLLESPDNVLKTLTFSKLPPKVLSILFGQQRVASPFSGSSVGLFPWGLFLFIYCFEMAVVGPWGAGSCPQRCWQLPGLSCALVPSTLGKTR